MGGLSLGCSLQVVFSDRLNTPVDMFGVTCFGLGLESDSFFRNGLSIFWLGIGGISNIGL